MPQRTIFTAARFSDNLTKTYACRAKIIPSGNKYNHSGINLLQEGWATGEKLKRPEGMAMEERPGAPECVVGEETLGIPNDIGERMWNIALSLLAEQENVEIRYKLIVRGKIPETEFQASFTKEG